jgi:GNAT superfamily N-acetyltransferase
MQTTATPTLNFQEISIRPLDSKECLSGFACGALEIDKWVKNKAWKHHDQNRVRMFCAYSKTRRSALGFYCLSFTSEPPTKLDNNYRDIYKHTGVPLIYLQYVAVNSHLQNMRLGTFLLIDALRRANLIGRNIAVYGVALRSLNTRTTDLYKKFGFSSVDEVPLMIVPIWTIFDLFKATEAGTADPSPNAPAAI